MKSNFFRFITVMLGTIFFSCSNQHDKEDNVAEQLVERVSNLQKSGYMFGHQDDTFYGTTWEWDLDNSDTRLVTSDFPAIMGFDLGGIENGDEKNLDSVPFYRIREEIIKHYERGGIITISWHPRNPVTGGTAWIKEEEKSINVVKEITEKGSKSNEEFISKIDRVVSFLKTLKTKDDKPIPFIFRPWHENNGSWFWWGQDWCSDEEYKNLWNLLQDYTNERMYHNVVWSFSPNLFGEWTEDDFLKRYPGDDRVDIIGVDAYQWNTEKEFIDQLNSDLTFVSAFAKKHNKLIALTECGFQNSPDATWWTRVLKPIMDKYPICWFLVWRNYKGEHFGPAPNLSTKDDFIKLYNAENTLFLRDINR